MFRNYFITAFRNLLKNKFYTAINVFGLAIGLATGIMILFWVDDELSFDKFHHNARNIYKINSHLGSGIGEQVWEGAPSPIALFARKEIPEVVDAVRVKDNWGDITLFTRNDKKYILKNGAFVDPSFFSVFDFKLTDGDIRTPFKDANSVILSKSTVQTIFGTDDPINKQILADNKELFTVTGVMEDFPENSSVRYDVLFPLSNYAKKFGGNGDWKTIDDDLGNYYYKIFLQLQPGASQTAVEKKISQLFMQRHEGGARFALQRLADLHLYAPDGNSSAMQTVKIFSIVGFLFY
jgi:putative ABC transport system permease protein